MAATTAQEYLYEPASEWKLLGGRKRMLKMVSGKKVRMLIIFRLLSICKCVAYGILEMVILMMPVACSIGHSICNAKGTFPIFYAIQGSFSAMA
jgi:hypothetical protein